VNAVTRRSWLAKGVILTSAVVALASSPPPTWRVDQERQLDVQLDELTQQTFLLTIELGGALYADTEFAELDVWATADRVAGDLSLSVRPVTSAGEGQDPPLTDRETEDWPLTASPGLNDPTSARIALPVRCVELQRSERAATCSEQFEIRVERTSKKPLSVSLSAAVELEGSVRDQPAGTFELELEELVP
jgi:hypothetical protein